MTAAAPCHEFLVSQRDRQMDDQDKRRLTKLPTTAGAFRTSNDGMRADTSATRATPQNAPTNDQKAITTLPNGRGALSRYPRKCEIGRGSRCNLGAGTQGLINRSMSTCQLLTSGSVIDLCKTCDMRPKRSPGVSCGTTYSQVTKRVLR